MGATQKALAHGVPVCAVPFGRDQFEVARRNLTSSGVVRDEQMRLDAVQDVVDHAAELGWRDTWRAESRLPGPAGNIEHFVLFERA